MSMDNLNNNIDRYGKAATTVCARLAGIKSPVVVITSSIAQDSKIIDNAEGFASSLTRLNKNVALVNAKLGGKSAESGISVSDKNGFKLIELKPSDDKSKKINDKSVATILDKLKAEHDFIVVATDCISTDDTAMFFSAQSNGIILSEAKKLSRTDEIERALDTIKSINSEALGFIYSK